MNPQQHFATYNPQQQQPVYARASSGNLGAFATQTGMNASMPLQAWTPPSPPEQHYYDMLFSLVDEQRRNAIGGQQAVAFFTRSHVDKAILREVWSIADTQRKSELSRNEFYVAMRLISMAQRGEQVSVQRFYQFAAMQFPLPVMEGVPPPQTSGVQQPHQHVQPPQHAQQDFGSVQQPPTSNGATGYALTTDEKSKYDIVFQQYDTDCDGFLMGPEAVALFQMSGLDRNVLRDIWAMADVTHDSKLSVQEFYVAMHLIVCVSKRGLPMPSTLPRELGETAFGTGGVAQGLSGHVGFGSQVSGTVSGNGFSPVQQQESAPALKPMGMSAFDSFSNVEDAPLPSFDSSTPRSSQAESLNNVEANAMQTAVGGFGESSVSTSTASFQGGFPAPTGQQDFNNISAARTPSFTSAVGRDRTNSGSSLSSMSSFSGLASGSLQLPPRSLGSNERIQMPQAENLSFQAPPQAYSDFGGASFGTSQVTSAAPEKPFMSDEEEKNAVRQLDHQNGEVVEALAGVERKQSTIALMSEKLRDLDELRHELVSLVMKRESLRSVSASATGASDNSAEELTRRTVEQSLRALVDNQKQLISQLHLDISRHEGELEEAVLSAKLQQKLSLESRSRLVDTASPPPSTQDSGAASGRVNAFTGAPLSLDGSHALLSPLAAPSAPSLSAFSPSPSPDATDSSGFNAFSNYDSAPRSISSTTPSPAAGITAPSGSPFSPIASSSHNARANESFNAFSDAAPPSSDAGTSIFSLSPSPAATSDVPAGFDAFGAAPVTFAATEDTPDSSPFSPPASAAATDGNGFDGFASPTTSAEVPGHSPFSPAPISAAMSVSSDFVLASVSTDFAAPSSSPVDSVDTLENSELAPSAAAMATSAFDAFASPPVQSSEAANASGNSPFSPLAAAKSDSDTFGEFGAATASTDNAAGSFESEESPENLLPSPAAAMESSGFGDFNALPVSTEHSFVAASDKTTENSPFSPIATSSDFIGFNDFNSVSDTAPSSTMEKAVESSFSPIGNDNETSSFEVFGDFVSTDSAEPVQAAEATGSSPFSPVAADSSGFGDFNAALSETTTPAETKSTETSNHSPFSPVAVDNGGFEAFGDFKAAPTSSDNSKPETTKESTDFGDFSAASSTSDGFGNFN